MRFVQMCVYIYVAFLTIITTGVIGIENGISSHGHGGGHGHGRGHHDHGGGHHRHGGGHGGRRHPPQGPTVPSINTIVVDKSGRGNYSTIQSAINAVRSNNTNWICIYVKAGTYNEKVKIPADKPMIYLKGEGRQITNVVWGTPLDTYSGATFLSEANNILVQAISFTNSYNYPPEKNQNPIKMATAATISGDKTAFYGCGFFGFQDTLWDNAGRHYFKDCLIEGAVDFIMGNGQSIYERSTISGRSKTLGGIAGFITANSRDSPQESSGFVFKNCKVEGDGPILLGRAWRAYARVLFYQSFLSNNIAPVGWDAWTAAGGREHQLTFAEKDCRGPGSDTSKRVSWENNNLSQRMLQSLTSLSFINKDGWISQQPLRSYLLNFINGNKSLPSHKMFF